MDSFGGVETNVLKAVFLPFISKSHLIRVVDTARIFAIHGVDVTIITTPANGATFQPSIDRDSSRGHSIRTHVVQFPHVPGVPHGLESLDSDTPQHMGTKIYEALCTLQEQFQQLFREMRPDFIVSDMYYPWTVDAAAELGIPRLVCNGGSYLAAAAAISFDLFQPLANVGSETETFLIPGFPHELKMMRSQLSDWNKGEPSKYTYMMRVVKESERKSYGSLFNSFYELEGTYEEHYKKIMGTKSWSVGPVSLWANQDDSDSDKAFRGHGEKGKGKGEEGKEGERVVLDWLDSKTEDSVLYVSFGSMNKFPKTQLVEIAHALEDSSHDFIWVVGKIVDCEGEDGVGGEFLKEFEKRVREKNRGYLIWGWAPQLLILEHPAVGAVVTHCGWNTTMESVNAGLPIATWPLFAEQFFNEKLLVDVARIGVSVGSKQWRNWNEVGDEVVKRENIGRAIAFLMGDGDEALETRKRVKVLSGATKKATQVGGSSHTNLKKLIEELKSIKLQKSKGQPWTN